MMEHPDASIRREKPSSHFIMALHMLCAHHQNVLKINIKLTALFHLLPLEHLILAYHNGDLSPMIMRAPTKPHGDHRLHPHLVEELIKAAKEEVRATNVLSHKGIDIREQGKEAMIANNSTHNHLGDSTMATRGQ